MKWVADIIGLGLTLLGLFWILQGTGVVPVGFMANQTQWAVIGLILGVIGAGLLVYVNRRSGSNPRATGSR